MKRIAIIGGGISGLSAAFALEQQRRTGSPIEYLVYESGPQAGGVLRTIREDDCLLEAGPDSFLTEKPWATELCQQVGLGDQLIGSNDAGRKTYIVVNGKVVLIPDGLMFMVPSNLRAAAWSPLFSVRTKLRIAGEWFQRPRHAGSDETVASFVDRHYGPEMVERLVDPMLSGIYGGAAGELSLRAVLPRFAAMEAKFGSLGRGVLANRTEMKRSANGQPRSIFTSLKNGMQSMSDAVLACLPPSSVRANLSIQAILQQAGGWTVFSDSPPKTDRFDAVIVATPARSACKLLEGVQSSLASELAGIGSSSSITVCLTYGAETRAALPPGFGFLVPRSEGMRMIATTFVHNKFPHRVPEDRALLRCFMGGSRNGADLDLSDDDILAIVRAELRRVVGVTAKSRVERVYRWPGAMPLYGVGHLDRMDRIDRLVGQLPGLALAGNSYRGIGVPDCVRSGTQAAAQIMASLGMPCEVAG